MKTLKLCLILFTIFTLSNCKQTLPQKPIQEQSNLHFIKDLQNGFSVYKNEHDLYALYSNNQKTLISSFKYHNIDLHLHNNNMFCFYKNEATGLDVITPNGTVQNINHLTYLNEEAFGRIIFGTTDNSLGIIDADGNIIVKPNVYKDIRKYSDSLAVVKDNLNKYGFIDIHGKVVIPFIYDQVDSFKEGIALVQTKDASYLIDKKQNILVTGPKEAQYWPAMRIISKHPAFYQMGSSKDPNVKYYSLKGKEIKNPKNGLLNK